MNLLKNQFRVNHRIRATEVRVIAQQGAQVGVLPISQALKLAMEQGLDLVEVAPDAKPPVCRIVDFGKFRYEIAKRAKTETRHVHATKLKELKFHINIGEHDYAIRLRHAKEFLEKGMRVKMSLYFRGREMQHQELGIQLMRRILQDVSLYAHTDSEPRLIGKTLHMILVPGKAKPKLSGTQASVSIPRTSHTHPAPTNSSRPFGTNIKIDLKSTPFSK